MKKQNTVVVFLLILIALLILCRRSAQRGGTAWLEGPVLVGAVAYVFRSGPEPVAGCQ